MVGCDAIEIVSHRRKVRNIHCIESILQQGLENVIVAVDGIDGSQPRPFVPGSMPVVVTASASRAAELHVTPSGRQFPPAFQAKPGLLSILNLHNRVVLSV